MTVNEERMTNRRALLLKRRDPQTSVRRASGRAASLFNYLVRAGFLLLVAGVLAGVYLVSTAHLTEQFLGTPKSTTGLLNPTESQWALNPDNIEKQVLAFSLRLREDELTRPAGSNPRQRRFVINPGEPARFVAARLQEEGFVLDGDLFNLYLRVTGQERRIEAGNFMLADTMTVPEITKALQHALFEEVNVTIPEGFRAEEIADRLATNNVIDSETFLTAIRQPRTLEIFAEYDFLQALPAGASLEGFLFPDTYRFPVLTSEPELIIASFLSNFDNKVGSSGLVGGGSGLSGRDLVTLASIVEREAVRADERPLIASVYINRINNACPDVGGNYLQADPTVQYANGSPGNWWWKPQNIEDYAKVTSPYNTYLNPGLPPGPIANPGLNAIEATRNPESTVYCFFVATGEDGSHVFAQTLAEHEANLQAYGYK